MQECDVACHGLKEEMVFPPQLSAEWSSKRCGRLSGKLLGALQVSET
jgi:hypothetical protein